MNVSVVALAGSMKRQRSLEIGSGLSSCIEIADRLPKRGLGQCGWIPTSDEWSDGELPKTVDGNSIEIQFRRDGTV